MLTSRRLEDLHAAARRLLAQESDGVIALRADELLELCDRIYELEEERDTAISAHRRLTTERDVLRSALGEWLSRDSQADSDIVVGGSQ